MHSNTAIREYLRGYQQKTADVTDFLAALTERSADAAKAALLAAPLAGGALLGAGISKLTSSEDSAQVLQKAMVVQELERTVAELERRKALAVMSAGKVSRGKKARTLHI
jgi:hypothetical protein